LKDIIKEKVLIHKTPIIGICLGMQLLTDFSEEGQVDGLSLIKAKTLKFSFSDNTIKIPHVGWNNIKIKRQNILLENIPDDAQFYFTHSYYVTCEKEDNIVATTNYGHDFDSIINNENIWGVQFHPEKSHKQGLVLLKNFIENA